MTAMNTRLLDDEITYTGAQLRSGWIAEASGLTGDAAVAFLGPCDVAPEHMVDTVDLQAGARIYSPRMVHIIVEHPELDLMHITIRQRLLMAIAGELINSHLGEMLVRREGDDLYLRDRKLSVSVATVSLTASGTAGFSLPSTNPGTVGFSLPSTNPGTAGFSLPSTNPGTVGFSLPSTNPGTAGFSLPSATVSSSSGLIHSGFNVRGEGAPVPAIGLEELGLAPRAFAECLLTTYAHEIESAASAAAKVRPV